MGMGGARCSWCMGGLGHGLKVRLYPEGRAIRKCLRAEVGSTEWRRCSTEEAAQGHGGEADSTPAPQLSDLVPPPATSGCTHAHIHANSHAHA